MEPNDQTLNNTHLASASPDDYIAHLHRKPQDDTPRFSRRETGSGFARRFSASKKLQRFMGLQEPGPFVKPPEMMKDLVEKFVEALEEYEQIYTLGMRMTKKTVREAEKWKLPNILEETESIAKATDVTAASAKTDTKGSLGINSPVWLSKAQAILGSGRQEAAVIPNSKLPVSCASDNARDIDIEHATSDQLGKYAHRGFNSSTIPAGSQLSHPESSTSASISFLSAPITQSASAGNQGNGNVTQRSVSAPITPKYLFPSPRVDDPPWDFVQIQTIVSDGHNHHVSSTALDENPTRSPSGRHTSNIPRINVQSPSPKKLPMSRRRAPSLTTPGLFGPPPARARTEYSTGLPIFSLESEALWKFKFPGNTHALLTILLTWSYAMQSCYNRCPNPTVFSFNVAFPYAVKPPVYQHLISVSFYDTSILPHKEFRFLGPGDAAEITYGEVDTFRSEKDSEAFQEHLKQDCRVEAMKRALGLETINQKDGRHMSMHQRAATGEGRWGYILIKGHQTGRNETPPHVMIAFHISAITDSSTCLHTIFPDNHPVPSAAPLPPRPFLRRSFSLQNLINGSRKPLRMHQVLHSASSSELPQGDVANIAPQEGAQTLRRTLLKLGKAGSVPLIEGYRVDVQAFRGWLDAAGRGSGKVIMWREKE
ncbi:Nn.00g046460.m01.CDS01 [Neocucurbitaria sp. VM-36]